MVLRVAVIAAAVPARGAGASALTPAGQAAAALAVAGLAAAAASAAAALVVERILRGRRVAAFAASVAVADITASAAASAQSFEAGNGVVAAWQGAAALGLRRRSRNGECGARSRGAAGAVVGQPGVVVGGRRQRAADAAAPLL